MLKKAFSNHPSITKISRGIIVALIVVGYSLFAGDAHAAIISASTRSTSYNVGDLINVSVKVASSDQSMNAISGKLSFSPSKLQVVSLSKSGSIINFWAQEPSFSNSAGTVSFEGVVLNPGYQGGAGQIISAVFKAKQAGTVDVLIADAVVAANDGRGTNILTDTQGTTLTISPKTASDPAPTVAPTPVVNVTPVDTTLVLPTVTPTPAQTSTDDAGLITIQIKRPSTAYIYGVGGVIAALLLFILIVVCAEILFQRFKQRIRVELSATEKLLHKSLSLLKDDFESNMVLLTKARSKRALTVEEDKILKQMSNDVSDVEYVFNRKVADIKKLIK